MSGSQVTHPVGPNLEERGAAALTARWHCSKVTGTFEHRLLLRAPARYALWRRAPLQGPPPWPPSVSTSAARRPIALRREPTFLRP